MVGRIFISYSKAEPGPTEKLAKFLTARGYIVWWDTNLNAGEVFRKVIDRELDAADAVIVIWTPNSVASDWVIAEADHAARQNKLITVRTQDLQPWRIPKPYNTYQTDTVDNHQGILRAVRCLAGEPPKPEVMPSPGLSGAASHEALAAASAHAEYKNLTERGTQRATPVNPDNPYDKVFIFHIKNGLSEHGNVYEATRQAWPYSRHMGSGGVAVGLVDGISRGVYIFDRWDESPRNTPDKDPKYVFETANRHDDNSDRSHEFLNKDWSRIIGMARGYWQRGNYLIVAFDGRGNCKFLRGLDDGKNWHKL